jgi:ion channel-forming bestrophin family protein
MTITSFALSLLLVFRTNSSYDRFVEARHKWGDLIIRSRDLVRQCIAFFPLSAWDDKSSFARWTIAVAKALLCQLRSHSSLKDEVSQVLGKQEMQLLLAADHPVIMVLQVRILNSMQSSEHAVRALDESAKVAVAMNVCSQRTPE